MRLCIDIASLAFLPAAWAATACPEHYAGGQPPTITKASLKPRTQELCFRAFGLMHSGLSRGRSSAGWRTRWRRACWPTRACIR